MSQVEELKIESLSISENKRELNQEEYEVTCSIIRRKYMMAVNMVDKPVRELTFEFLHYSTGEDLHDIVAKSLELQDVDVKLESVPLEREKEPRNVCKCTLSIPEDDKERYLINDVTLIVNSINLFGDSIIYDTVRHIVIKGANTNSAISVVTGLPYILSFNANEKIIDNLLNLIQPVYDKVRKNVNELSQLLDIMLETFVEEDSVKLVIHLVFV